MHVPCHFKFKGQESGWGKRKHGRLMKLHELLGVCEINLLVGTLPHTNRGMGAIRFSENILKRDLKKGTIELIDQISNF